MSTLEVRDLTVDFRSRGERLRAVDRVSLSLEAGRTVALVGESGSGKSTIVRALSRLTAPSAGEILLDGAPAGRHGSALRGYRRRVQMVFQDPFASLNPTHTVAHHLKRPLLVQGRARRDTVDQAVRELLGSVNLVPEADIAAKYPHELSGGQRQRVAIARAIATEPDVLLADEPVSMLDVSIRLEILNLLDRLKRDRDLALLYVTHDLATARHFSSEVLVLYRGEIVERGPADEVIGDPRHPYTQLLAAAAPDGSRSREEKASERRARLAARSRRDAEQREVVIGDGCRFRARCPFAMPVCTQRPPEVAVGPGRRALCWLYAEGKGAGAGVSGAVGERVAGERGAAAPGVG